MIKTFFMNAIEKLIGQLIMIPYGIDFNIEVINEKRYDGEMIEEIIVTVNVDDSKIVQNSENYDETYSKEITDYLDDKIQDSLKYINKQDVLLQVRYNHYNKTYMNQLEREFESIINDYILRASQEDRTKYEFDAFIDASRRAPHLFLTINTNLPDNRQKELWYKLGDEHGYDDLVIEFDEYV